MHKMDETLTLLYKMEPAYFPCLLKYWKKAGRVMGSVVLTAHLLIL